MEMIGQIPRGIELLQICGEIVRELLKKEGCLMRQIKIQKMNYLALMNGMMRSIVSFMFNFFVTSKVEQQIWH